MATGADDRLLAERALADPEPGVEMVRRMFGFVAWGLVGLPKNDPMREPLARIGAVLTSALAEAVA